MRIIVVGSGAAGLLAAYRAATSGHEVVLVTKADLPESNTRYAQGGVAAVMPEADSGDDTTDSHVADTLVAGAGMCDAAAVRVLCAEGPERVRDLLALGLDLDRVDGPGSPLARGREAAHSAARVLHSHGDATGLSIEIALIEAVRTVPLELHEHTMLRDLVVEAAPAGPGAAGRRVVGVDVVHADGSSSVLRGDAVVLATGGAGQLFQYTTNPEVTTGDGVAAALRAGAVAADLEFYQFHPTALAVPGTPLISEAVRGEGAVLRDGAGRRFMLGVHPGAELAPRDVVARAIAAAMDAQGGGPVYLDATALGGERLARRFPGLTATLQAHGFDWGTELVPVTPAAHYWMGGIRTDLYGRTSLPGLFAAGEAACTGVHGANRLASNSLLEALVFGWRAAGAAGTTADWPPFPPAHPLPISPTGSTTSPPQSTISPTGSTISPPPTPRDSAPGARDSALGGRDSALGGRDSGGLTRAALQALLWQDAGLVRDAAGLQHAAAVLATAQPAVGDHPFQELEDRNLIGLGRAVVAAALARTESRGAQARSDFPGLDPAQAVSTAWHLPAAALVPVTAPVTGALA